MNVFQKYFTDVWMHKYADFKGRARRSEYWFFMLFKWVIIFGMIHLHEIIGSSNEVLRISSGLLFVIFYMALFIPSLAVTIRRLHDTGNSGWMLFLNIIPFIGAVIIFVFTLLDSQNKTNKWGPNPKNLIPVSDDVSDILIKDDLV